MPIDRKKEKDVAIHYRNDLGLSYGEIIARMKQEGYVVSRGSLSNWLRVVEVKPEQKRRLNEKMVQTGRTNFARANDARRASAI